MNNGNWKICHLLENRNEQQFTRTQKTGALIALFRTNNSIGKHMPKTEWMSLLLICYYLFRISAAEHSNSRERSNIFILNDNNQFRPFWQLNEIVLNSLHTTAKCQLKWGIPVRTPGRSSRWKERESWRYLWLKLCCCNINMKNVTQPEQWESVNRFRQGSNGELYEFQRSNEQVIPTRSRFFLFCPVRMCDGDTWLDGESANNSHQRREHPLFSCKLTPYTFSIC